MTHYHHNEIILHFDSKHTVNISFGINAKTVTKKEPSYARTDLFLANIDEKQLYILYIIRCYRSGVIIEMDCDMRYNGNANR